MSSPSGGAGNGASGGAGSQNAPNPKKSSIDIEALARKVYNLMLQDARLSSHRNGSPRRPERNGRL